MQRASGNAFPAKRGSQAGVSGVFLCANASRENAPHRAADSAQDLDFVALAQYAFTTERSGRADKTRSFIQHLTKEQLFGTIQYSFEYFTTECGGGRHSHAHR